MFTSLKPRPIRSLNFAPLTIVVIALWVSISTMLFAQTAERPSTEAFSSPQKTLDRFDKAVRAEKWREEYLSYSHSLRSRFTYFLIRAVDELSSENDLMLKASQALQEQGVPDEAFTNYTSLRAVNQSITPEEFQQQLQQRLDRWKNEIYPKVAQWSELIEDLQPLLSENHKRHELDPTHPSQTGIIRHFNFHYYEPATDLTFSQRKAQAKIVAIVRDPNWESVEDPNAKADVKQASFIDRFSAKITRLVSGSNIRRPPENVQLIFEDNEWRIDSIPYR